MMEQYRDKTRILVLGTPTGRLFKYILDFHGKEVDMVTPDSDPSPGIDFAVMVTGDTDHAAFFHPNIVLTTGLISHEINKIPDSIVAGGVYIYPEHQEETMEIAAPSSNFFRRIPYTESRYTPEGDSAVLETELGPLPLPFSAPQICDHLEGLKILCQQVGLMEEAFYEAIMNYTTVKVN